MHEKIRNTIFVLGSQSPRRRGLFEQVGYNFRIEVANINEVLSGSDIASNTEQLAKQKAEAITAMPTECVVTADTLVGLNNEILGKPKTAAEAKLMLEALSNQWHEVYTGVCIRYKNEIHVFNECTNVFIHPLLESDIDFYVSQHSPMDKAGSYGIQDWFGLTQVGEIKGCYYNVMGFPMPKFYKEIQKIIV